LQLVQDPIVSPNGCDIPLSEKSAIIVSRFWVVLLKSPGPRLALKPTVVDPPLFPIVVDPVVTYRLNTLAKPEAVMLVDDRFVADTFPPKLAVPAVRLPMTVKLDPTNKFEETEAFVAKMLPFTKRFDPTLKFEETVALTDFSVAVPLITLAVKLEVVIEEALIFPATSRVDAGV
jgi:hypothetical protein